MTSVKLLGLLAGIFVFLGFGALAWDLRCGVCGLGNVACIFSFGSLAWDLGFRIFGLRWLEIFDLGSLTLDL